MHRLFSPTSSTMAKKKQQIKLFLIRLLLLLNQSDERSSPRQVRTSMARTVTALCLRAKCQLGSWALPAYAGSVSSMSSGIHCRSCAPHRKNLRRQSSPCRSADPARGDSMPRQKFRPYDSSFLTRNNFASSSFFFNRQTGCSFAVMLPPTLGRCNCS